MINCAPRFNLYPFAAPSTPPSSPGHFYCLRTRRLSLLDVPLNVGRRGVALSDDAVPSHAIKTAQVLHRMDCIEMLTNSEQQLWAGLVMLLTGSPFD